MKMKGFWKKFIAKVLTAVMLVSVFSTVDMGDVRKVHAEDQCEEFTEDDWKSSSYNFGDPLKKTYTQATGSISKNSFDGGFTFGKNNSITVSTTPEGASAGYEIKKVEFSDMNGSVTNASNTQYTNLEKWYTTSGIKSGNTGGMRYFKTITVSDVYAPSVTISFSDENNYIHYSNMKVYYGLHVCSSSTVKTNGAAQNATCTTDGWNAYSVCSCNKVYAQGNFSTSYASVNAWKTSVAGKRPQLGHSFGYTGSGNIITAKCNNDASHTAKLTLTANGGTYDGTPKPATVSNWSVSTLSGLAPKPTTITYKNQSGTATYNNNTAPTNVGNYTASITVNGATATKNFSITKKNVAAGDLTVTCRDSVYDGQAKSASVSVASGKTGLGEITVKYQKQNGTGWDEATTDEPVNAGTYRILVSTAESDNFNATSSDLTNDAWKFTISKKLITINPDSGQEKNFGEDDPTFTYSYNQSDLISEDDEITGELGRQPGEDVKRGGYAYTTGTLSAGDNYTFKIADSAPKFMIKRLDTIAPPAPGEGYDLDYDEEKLSAEPATEYEIGKMNEGGEIVPISSPAGIEPGETYYVRYKDNDNHPSSNWTLIHVAERPAAPAPSTVVERTENSIKLQMIPGVEYSLNGTNWFIATDADKNVTVSEGQITFGGLTPDTNYTIHSRVKATDSAPKSLETTQTVKTKKALPDDLTTLFDFNPPTGEDLTYNKQPKEAEVTPKEAYPGIGTPVIKYYDAGGNEVQNPTDAGEYTVKVSTPPTDDYPAVQETVIGKFTIKKKPITITPDTNQSKVYGTPDPVITYTHSPELCTGDGFTGGLTYTGAGLYASVKNDYLIVKGTLSAGNNYELNLTSGVTFEITKAEHESGPTSGLGYIIDYLAETLAPASVDFEIGKKNGEVTTVIASDSEKLAPGETALEGIYYVRYKENTNQTSSSWTAITIPARPEAPNAVANPETVKNKRDAKVTGVNASMEYQIGDDTDDTRWTTVSSTSIDNPDNQRIIVRIKASIENRNFSGYTKELSTTDFPDSEELLTVRMGDTVVKVPYGGTIPLADKPIDPTAPTGQVFMHWVFGGEKWNFDGETDDKGNPLTPSEVTGNITLVPVYGVEISGTITAQDYESITEVSLVDGKGNKYKHRDLERNKDDAGNFIYTYTYSVIAPAGVDYNLVIQGTKSISGNNKDITKTQLINLVAGGGDVSMPAGAFSSKVTKTDARDFENTLVGGLDEIADSHDGSQNDVVLVELKVSATVTNESEIKNAKAGKNLDFVELTLTKKVNDAAAEDIGSTNTQLLEIIIPYQTAGRYNIEVYRYHDGNVDTLTTTPNSEGEYIVIGPDTITIHAKKFSTYAIGYVTTPPASGNSGSGSSGGTKKPEASSTSTGAQVYRLYSAESGDHLLTTNAEEKDAAEKDGWRYEGVAFVVGYEGRKVYRLFNPITGEHFYTTSEVERNVCLSNGWRLEGIAFTTDGTKDVYRLYNGEIHLFTTDVNERNYLISQGWKYEGVAFKAN